MNRSGSRSTPLVGPGYRRTAVVLLLRRPKSSSSGERYPGEQFDGHVTLGGDPRKLEDATVGERNSSRRIARYPDQRLETTPELFFFVGEETARRPPNALRPGLSL